MDVDITTMSDAEIVAALEEAQAKAAPLFALETPTIAEVNEAVALSDNIKAYKAEQAARDAKVKEAGEAFAAAKLAFSSEGETDEAEGEADEASADEAEGDAEPEGDEPEVEAEGDGTVEAASKDDGDGTDTEDSADTTDDKKAPPFSLDGRRVTPSVAKKVGRKTTRPARPAASPVTITAAADVKGFSTGQEIDGMDEVAIALTNRAEGLPKFNLAAAQASSKATGGEPQMRTFPVAAINIQRDAAMVASQGNEYGAVRAALREDRNLLDALSASSWCAPSENVYSFLAGYTIDGLVSLPEIGAPRGGVNMTTGPTHELIESDDFADTLDAFGWDATETEADDPDFTKTFEVITCPDFTEHRLDVMGHAYTIPFLTQKAYPEIVADALRFAAVLDAHKKNKKDIGNMLTLSVADAYTGLGAVLTDTLEALSIIAVRERRKWHVGVNKVLEVKLPEWALELFRTDLSRRTGVPVDAVTDQQIASHFAVRKLSVEYLADWAPLTGTAAAWPANLPAMIYPEGTFVRAVEDVVNLSAVYDAASLSKNTYTGVFFEQGRFVAQAGYGSSKISIPITEASRAGLTGAAVLGADFGS